MSKSNPLLYPRVLNAVCKHAELRRLVVQQGGSKALIPLALDGTDKGTRCAALARIGITQDPAIAFLCCLFWSVKDWRTFENLASLNESTRQEEDPEEWELYPISYDLLHQVKNCVLLSEDDVDHDVNAASVALAMLTSASNKCCKNTFES